MDRRVVALSVVLLVAASLAFLGSLAPAAQGQGDEIAVVSREVESDFPNSITFRLTATSPDQIQEVRVFLKTVGEERSTYGYMDIEPGKSISGEYVMTTGTGPTHSPPGTAIRYSFDIRDAAGRVLRTQEEEFLYMDDRQEWKRIVDPEGLLTVYYYGDFVENRAKTVLETAKETQEKMGRVLGITTVDPITIVAYSNYRDMSRALPFRSQAVREGLQTEGQAWPEERVLLVLMSETNVIGIASHEFTHILLAEATGAGYSRVPAWLNEGLAEYGNLDQTPHYDWALDYAIFTRRLKPLWYLDAFRGDPDDITMAYGQGKAVVQALVDQYGEGKIAELMRVFRTGVSADEALEEVYGFDQYGLDSLWRQSLGLEPLPPPAELARELTRVPGSTAVAEVEVSSPTTPQAESTPVSAAVGERKGTARSCGAPSEGSASLPLDLAMMALLGGPFLALNTRWGFHKARHVHLLRSFHRMKRRLHRIWGGRGR